MAKTLFVTNDFGPRAGGIETFMHGLIERFPKDSVIVYTSQQGDTRQYDQKWLADYGVQVIRDRAKILLPTPRVIRKVRKVVATQNPASVVFGAAAPLALMGKALKVPRKIAITHGHEVWWAKVPPFNLAIRLIGNSVDHLTYLGEYTKSQISKPLSNRARAAMVQISPGIDTNKFKPVDAKGLRAELGLTDKEVIVSVGRLVPRKGQDQLIKALPQILKSRPSAHLLLVGTGPYKERLEKLIAERSLKDYVTFTGRVQYEDLAQYICVGDIFAMPSRSRLAGLEVEGLGIVYLEASACGLPVLGGDSGGAPDAVLPGVTGLIVNGREVSEIAIGVIKLLQSDRSAMASAGRNWAIAKWDWELWAKQFVALVRD
ncbi:MAG: glycosyltransferase family 4 protein [Candidatus Nanopelagicaceae bacterium]